MKNDTRALSVKEFLDADEKKDLLRLLTAGSVDDGKSTLIGRLLFDSKRLYEDQLDALERDSRRVGNAGGHIDYALLLDGLKAEREEGITIDVAYRYFSTNRRKFIIADTPGHEQYTRNMITGGSTASLAIILLDARHGVVTQTRRHSFLVSLLGIEHVVLAVNKMDLVDFSEQRFAEIVEDYRDFASALSLKDITAIPLSALEGDNVVERSARTPWYEGPSLLEFLETVPLTTGTEQEEGLRFPVQYVMRPNLDVRGFCGKVCSGEVRKGDEVVALPSMRRSHVSRIILPYTPGLHDADASPEDLPEVEHAFRGQSVTLLLEDEIDLSRGEMLVHPSDLPHVGRSFEAMLVWMDEEVMDPSKDFYLKHTTNTSRTRIDHVQYRVDVNTMEQIPAPSVLRLNEIGRVTFQTSKPLFFDAYAACKSTGSFVLIDPITNNTAAVGMIVAPVSEGDLHRDDAPFTLNLPRLGIGPEHHDAIRRAVESLSDQGIAVEVVTA